MLPGEKEAVERLRELTGASVDYCHMALVRYGSTDAASEHIRVSVASERRTGTPYRLRRAPTHHQQLAVWWQEKFGAPWPQRPQRPTGEPLWHLVASEHGTPGVPVVVPHPDTIPLEEI